MSNNPLKAHFRQPAISFELPSKGEFWDDGAIEIGMQPELDIYPMTAADEIMLRTPDSLMNGSAVAKLIQSCIPSIKNALKTPTIDVEALLIAIRIASVSDSMDITVKCPKCGEEHDYEIDLNAELNSIKAANWKQPAVIDNLQIFYRPLTLEEVNTYNTMVFKNKRLAKQIEQLEEGDEKEQLANNIIKDMHQTKIQQLVQSIQGIVADGELVSDKNYIAEYLLSCEKKTYKHIEKRFEDLKATTHPEDVEMQCSSCEHKFSMPFSLDYSNFFV
jgi:hypothetical protein